MAHANQYTVLVPRAALVHRLALTESAFARSAPDNAAHTRWPHSACGYRVREERCVGGAATNLVAAVRNRILIPHTSYTYS